MYSIGKVSEMFGLPVSTLRYYDKEGLFPDMMRVSGVRKFSDREAGDSACHRMSQEIRHGDQGYPPVHRMVRHGKGNLSAAPCHVPASARKYRS